MSDGSEGKKTHVEARQLETRHAFLDTQVYRKLKHNPANRVLRLLAEHVAGYRLVLHITDITLNEVSRQIAEDVELTRVAMAKSRKNVERWRHTLPDIAAMPDLDGETAGRLFAAFRNASSNDWRAKEHTATTHPALEIFADYFAKRAPFDTAGSKEFPDAFVLHTLEAWCAAEGETMYVVTRDAAMKRFVDGSEHLLALDSIEELLVAASASAEGDSDTLAEMLLNAPEFDHYLEEAIESRVDELILIYEGDLAEGEVAGAEFGGVIHSLNYRIVSRTSARIGLLVNVDVELEVDVGYENRRYAIYDREDDAWIGGEWDSTVISASVTLELYLEIDLATGRIARSELIRNEYGVG